VGKKPSEAESFLNDVDEVAELLKSLTKISTREKRFFSSVDLPSMDAGMGKGLAGKWGVWARLGRTSSRPCRRHGTTRR